MTLTCPLCESGRIFTLRSFELAALQQEWVQTFRFDPFPAFRPTEPTLRQHRCGTCDLEFYSPDYIGDAPFYERLAQADWYYESNKWEFDEALRRLNRNPQIRTLLEIGCGNGGFLEKTAACYEARGIELNDQAVQACQAKQLNVTNSKLAALAQRFDAIVAFEVLEHLGRPREFLRQACEALSPGGTLIFAVPNPAGYLRELDHVLLDMPPHHATRWSSETFAYVSREFGLRLVELATEPLRYVHYQGYLAALAAGHHRLDGSSLRKRIQRRLAKVFSPVLERTLLPLGYQYHKQTLLGQTHLVEYRKP